MFHQLFPTEPMELSVILVPCVLDNISRYIYAPNPKEGTNLLGNMHVGDNIEGAGHPKRIFGTVYFAIGKEKEEEKKIEFSKEKPLHLKLTELVKYNKKVLSLVK